jgi:hypothetical protein
MKTKSFHTESIRTWLALAGFTLSAGLALAAGNPAAPANSTVPQNPFGPKSDTPAPPSANQSPSGNTPSAPIPITTSGDNFVTALRAMLLRRFDKNSTGQLDATELAEARKVLSDGQDLRTPTPEQAAFAANGPLFGLRPLIMKRFDHQGTGQLDASELAEINTVLFGAAITPPNPADDLATLQQNILHHFDQKGDGQLDPTERAAAKAWLEQVIADLDQPSTEKPASAMK